MSADLRVAVAGIPGAWSTEVLHAALGRLGVRSFTFDLGDTLLDLNRGTVFLDGQDLGALDGLVIKKLGESTYELTPARVETLRQIEATGVREFSQAGAIERANDRYRMTHVLAQAALPVPRTAITEDLDTASDLVEEWQRAVLKPRFTSKGRGMLLLAHDDVYRITLRQWRRQWRQPFYLQEYVAHPGRDIGVTILGEEVLGAFYRVGLEDQWLTTTAAGGHYQRCDVDDEKARLALEAATLFGLDYTVVDLVETDRGYLIYEVSAFGGFTGLWRAHGIDAPSLYAGYIVQTLQQRRPR